MRLEDEMNEELELEAEMKKKGFWLKRIALAVVLGGLLLAGFVAFGYVMGA